MLRSRLLACVAIAAASLLSTLAEAANVNLAVQGRLTTTGGGPVADGSYPMALALYETEKGGAPLHYEAFLGVPVAGGVFAMTVGAGISPLDAAIFTGGKAAWLGVSVGPEPELPRVALHPVPYAISATAAATASALTCSGCVAQGQLASGAVGTTQLAPAAVTADQIAAGAVTSAHVAFTYAGSDSKGGPATTAVYADSAGTASSATQADTAKVAALADNATQADTAKVAAVADKATAADLAQLAVKATSADGLACTGCVKLDMLATDAVAAFVSSSGGTITGDLKVAGKLTAVTGQFSGGAVLGDDKGVCDNTKAGAIRFDGTHFYGCTGTGWRQLDNAPPPGVTGAEPANVPFSGGATITLKGTGFAPLATVTVGGVAATSVVVLSATSLSCVVPAATTLGAKDVVVSNADGQAGTGVGIVTYVADGTTKAMALASCKVIKAANPAGASALYWIDPNGGDTSDAYQVFCDQVHSGGGWTLVFNLDTNDGAMRSWGDTAFWQNQTATFGTLSGALKGDYKGSTYATAQGSEVLVWAHNEGAEWNDPPAWARYSLGNAHTGKTMFQLMNLGSNTTISTGTPDRSGKVATPGVYARNAGDVFIDDGLPIIVNSTGNGGTDATNTVRFGTDFATVCGIVNCNGHNVQGGYGGYHARPCCGGYPITYEAEPTFGYHPGEMSFGSDYVNNNGCGNSVWSNQCTPTVTTLQVDFAIFVR